MYNRISPVTCLPPAPPNPKQFIGVHPAALRVKVASQCTAETLEGLFHPDTSSRPCGAGWLYFLSVWGLIVRQYLWGRGCYSWAILSHSQWDVQIQARWSESAPLRQRHSERRTAVILTSGAPLLLNSVGVFLLNSMGLIL